ncbi:MAG: nuclear transport factor 2 family protein [Acidobacteria bacterium]|nr:nuclear transport factor 2 family protein [Acidobacteriota bacterium]
MKPEEEQILEANQSFYSAFQNLSLEQMESVWLQEDWVQCVHPGWDGLKGWEAIRESWQQIFESTQFIRIVVTVQSVRSQNSIAWVSCTEKISSASAGRFDSDYLQTTNIFLRQNGSWRLVHHHSSHRPVSPAQEEKAELVQ